MQQHDRGSENAKEEYYEEGEEEEDEEDYYNQYGHPDNPFAMGIDPHEEDKVDYNEHPIVQSQSKELQTVTLLVIEETLLEDFIIKSKADQKRELGNVDEVLETAEPVVDATQNAPDERKNNLQGEIREQALAANDPNQDEHKGMLLHHSSCCYHKIFENWLSLIHILLC
jgi:hypothetical protein